MFFSRFCNSFSKTLLVKECLKRANKCEIYPYFFFFPYSNYSYFHPKTSNVASWMSRAGVGPVCLSSHVNCEDRVASPGHHIEKRIASYWFFSCICRTEYFSIILIDFNIIVVKHRRTQNYGVFHETCLGRSVYPPIVYYKLYI